MNMIRAAKLGSLVLALLMLNGCATRKLWEERAFRQPAIPANLKLAFDPRRQDMLVCYDEFSDRSFKTRSRAFYLSRNRARLEAGRKPDFVTPGRAANLASVPWQTIEPPLLADPAEELQAVLTGTGDGFRLYSGTNKVGEYHLPVYADGVQRTGQILLTPFAVAADIVTFATVIGLIAWASGGLNSY